MIEYNYLPFIIKFFRHLPNLNNINLINITAGARFGSSTVSSSKCSIINDTSLKIVPSVSMISVNDVLNQLRSKQRSEDDSNNDPEDGRHGDNKFIFLIVALHSDMLVVKVDFHQRYLSFFIK